MRETGSGITPENLVCALNNELKNKSLNSIAKATGVGISALHRYQRGIGEPTTSTLEKLSDYFGVSVTWLRGYSPMNLEDEQKLYKTMSDSENKNRDHLAGLMITAQCLDLTRLKLLNQRADELLRDLVEEEAINSDPDYVSMYEDESLLEPELVSK